MWKRTKQGYLITKATIARTGELEYFGHEIGLFGADANKKFIVNRSESELFSAATIASFEGMPITLLHPDSADVDAETWKDKTIGHIQNVRREGDLLVCDAYIQDAAAIKVIEKLGLREVSCGYDSVLIKDEKGNLYQINIIGDHVAVVPEGRGGATCKLNDRKGKAMKKKFTLTNIISMLKGRQTNDAGGAPLTAEELAAMITTLEETLTQLEGKEDPETLAKIQEITTQLAELKETLEKTKVTDAEPPTGTDDVATLKTAVETLKTENETLKAENAQLKEELQKLKGETNLSSTLNDAAARFPKLKLNDAKSAREVKERVLVSIGAFNDASAKALSNEQVEAAYAAAQVTQNKSKLGNKMFADSAPEKHDLTKQFGGK